jgi:NUMOD4 motif/HNH endonuclease
MTEWRDVVGYEGLYQVSDDGQVKSLARLIRNAHGTVQWRVAERIRKSHRHPDGHLLVGLSRGGVKESCPVHQLMAKAFLAESWFPGAEVCHNDGVHAHNRVGNLRWGTSSDNRLDSVKHGTHAQAGKVQCPQGHWYTPENTRIESRRDGGSARRCRTCAREWLRAYRRRLKAERQGVAA